MKTSTTSHNTGSDGNFYCLHGDIGGTTGACSCLSCDPGYSGTHCETANACTVGHTGAGGTIDCGNNGTATGSTGNCTCTCATGFNGVLCGVVDNSQDLIDTTLALEEKTNELTTCNSTKNDCLLDVANSLATVLAEKEMLLGETIVLRNNLTMSEGEKNVLQTEKDRLANETTILLNNLTQVETERDQCVREKTAASVGFTNLTLQLAAERANCSLAITTLVNEHATIVEGQNNTIVELQHQLKELERQVTEKEDEKTSLKNEKAMLDERFQTTVQEKNTTIVELQHQLKELERQLAVEKENEEEKEETRTTTTSASTFMPTTESPALLQPQTPSTPSSSAVSCGFIECDALLIQRTGFDSTTMTLFGFGFFIYAMVISLAVVVLVCLRRRANNSFEKDLESFGVTKVKPAMIAKKKQSNERMLERLGDGGDGGEQVRQEENRASRRRSRQGVASIGGGGGGSQHI